MLDRGRVRAGAARRRLRGGAAADPAARRLAGRREPDEVDVDGRVGDAERVLPRRVAGARRRRAARGAAGEFRDRASGSVSTPRASTSAASRCARPTRPGNPVALDWDEKSGPPLVQRRKVDMAKLKSEFEVDLSRAARRRSSSTPTCSASSATASRRPAHRPELDDAQRILAEQAARREALFQQSVRRREETRTTRCRSASRKPSRRRARNRSPSRPGTSISIDLVIG